MQKKTYSFGKDKDLTEEEVIRRLKKQALVHLRKTDWTQVADEPLDMEAKKEYREYRQYLRNIDLIWKNRQITEPKVMKFEEWRENRVKFRYDPYNVWYLKDI